jgi:hypothetical protein
VLESKVAVDPGDSAWEALEKACRVAGILAVSDGQGGVVLTRAGSSRAATALVLGQNIMAIATDFEVAGTFRTYKVVGQKAGTDQDFGLEACSVMGEATDASVKRTHRVLRVRAESSVTRTQARTRAQWEATVRAARAATAQVTVSGWTQGDRNGRLGESLWPVNALVQVQAPERGEQVVDGAAIALVAAGADVDLGPLEEVLGRVLEAHALAVPLGEEGLLGDLALAAGEDLLGELEVGADLLALPSQGAARVARVVVDPVDLAALVDAHRLPCLRDAVLADPALELVLREHHPPAYLVVGDASG